jgi:hypothetical protein
LLLYINDIVLMASSLYLCHITACLSLEFAMTNLGALHHFLGISITRCTNRLFLSQRQYAIKLLKGATMSECHPTATLVDSKSKL